MFPGIGVGQQLRLAMALICLGHKFVGDAEYTIGYFLKCVPPLFSNPEDQHDASQQQQQQGHHHRSRAAAASSASHASSSDCSCVVWDRKEMIRLEESALVKLEMFGRVPALASKKQLVELLAGEYGVSANDSEMLTALFENGL